MLASMTLTTRRFGGAGAFADQDAEDVGGFLEIAVAGAVADAGDTHGGQGAEGGGKCRGDGGSGGGG